MDRVYIFDVDGTLTPSRRPMEDVFENFFFRWANKNDFYLVTGSDLNKLKEQVPDWILELSQGIFTCSGNTYHVIEDEELTLRYDNKFEPSDELLGYLQKQLITSPYKGRFGTHIENRGSMLNFSVVGRDCTLEQRLDFFEWDRMSKERESIANEINSRWPDIQAVIGGQISIDITPVGKDKSQVLEHIQNNSNKTNEYIFIGDRTMMGGNDYPLAKLMKETNDCSVYQAGEPSAENGYIETRNILEKLNG